MADVLPAGFDDRWIVALRGHKNRVERRQPYFVLHEREYASSGALVDVNTVFLSNRECPFKCLMCDLWKNTLDDSVQSGDIPAQIRWALDRLPSAEHIKLYNSGNFFDRKAIPREDFASIASLLEGYGRVVVESHPKLLGPEVMRFRDMLSGELEVAMGLETVHQEVLQRLNKRMTAADFRAGVRFLKAEGVHSRAFVLLRPPFMSEEEGAQWAVQSIEFAFEAGVECCAVIPTRTGNGALERLAENGLFQPPSLASLESVMERGLLLQKGRVLADLWDLDRFSNCDRCFNERKGRLEEMNRLQRIPPPVNCRCEDAA